MHDNILINYLQFGILVLYVSTDMETVNQESATAVAVPNNEAEAPASPSLCNGESDTMFVSCVIHLLLICARNFVAYFCNFF